MPIESTSPEPERFFGRGKRFFYRLSCAPLLNRQGEILSPGPASLVLDSGIKATPLLGPGNRGFAILSVS